MRTNLDDYTFISFEINKDMMSRLKRAMEQDGIQSRSGLIRQLLHAWITEVERTAEPDSEVQADD